MAALSVALTDPVSREALLSSQTVSPFTNIAVGDASYSGEAAIPEAGGAEGALPSPSHKLAVSSWTYGQALPRMRGRRGTFTGQCNQPFSCGDPTKHPDGLAAIAVCSWREERLSSPGASPNDGGWHANRGRNVRPPQVSQLGPFASECYHSNLALLPAEGRRFGLRSRYEYGLAPVGLDPHGSHRLRLSRLHLRLTRHSEEGA